MALVLGIGVGLLIVVILWSLLALSCVAAARSSALLKYAAVGAVGVVVVTLVLVLSPRKSADEAEGDFPTVRRQSKANDTLTLQLTLV